MCDGIFPDNEKCAQARLLFRVHGDDQTCLSRGSDDGILFVCGEGEFNLFPVYDVDDCDYVCNPEFCYKNPLEEDHSRLYGRFDETFSDYCDGQQHGRSGGYEYLQSQL